MHKRAQRQEKSEVEAEEILMRACPTGCASAAPPPIDDYHSVADTDAKKRTILLDAERRPLQARVGLHDL